MQYQAEYQRWLEALNGEERAELEEIRGDNTEIEARFHAPLQFGTAGLRGVMKLGTGCMNGYTVRHATQGLANLITGEGNEAIRGGVVIGYDCRRNSPEFAKEAACVLAAAGIPVRLFRAMCPTPVVSFAIRHYRCTAGINITASHNPKEYNGYKVYWADGAQLPPQHAGVVAGVMASVDIFAGVKSMDYQEAVNAEIITLLGEETNELFLKEVLAQSVCAQAVRDVGGALGIVYTPFHGTGYQMVPEALRRLGFSKIYCEPEQMVPDGSFPTVKSPNPENPEGFALAIALATEKDVDLIIGTDPDADRVGILVRCPDGGFVTMSGNQTGVLLLNYIIEGRKEAGTMPPNPFAVKTIVTTEMARTVGKAHGIPVYDTFTGFKFLAERVNEEEAKGGSYLLAYEESYGYLTGNYARDKDAVTASMLIAEMAAWYHKRGMTLYGAMEELYQKHGHYAERTLNLVMPGVDGLRKMAALMESLRAHPPAEIAGKTVIQRRDYLSGIELDTVTGVTSDMTPLKDSDVLSYLMDDDTRFIVRPSGTEPKVKVYLMVKRDNLASCETVLDQYTAFAESLAR